MHTGVAAAVARLLALFINPRSPDDAVIYRASKLIVV